MKDNPIRLYQANWNENKESTIRLSKFMRHRKLCFLILLASVLKIDPAFGRHGRGSSILETVGISTAVGLVLGASTLPFYEQPGDHVTNVLLGAGLGLLAGIGIRIFAPQGYKDDPVAVSSDHEKLLVKSLCSQQSSDSDRVFLPPRCLPATSL